MKIDLIRTLLNLDRLNLKDMKVESTSGDALIFTKGNVRLFVYAEDHFKVEVEDFGVQGWSVCCNEIDKWCYGNPRTEVEMNQVGLPVWVVVTHD